MIPQTTINSIEQKLNQTSDEVEKFFLLNEMATVYKQMWKLNKALEVSQEALNISQNLLIRYKVKKKKTRKPTFQDQYDLKF